MIKPFVCSIDNQSFATEEELTKHFLDEHTYKLVKRSSAVEDFLENELKEAFPEAEISVKESEERVRKYLVGIQFEKQDFEFGFYISPSPDEQVEEDNEYRTFEKVEDAIAYYQRIMREVEELFSKLRTRYLVEAKPVTLYERKLKSKWTTYLRFDFEVNEIEYEAMYTFDGVNKCLNQLRGHFDRKFEGEIRSENGTVYIDEVPMRIVLERAKRIRLDILEEKE